MRVRAPLAGLLSVVFAMTISPQVLAVPILDGTTQFIGDGGDLVVDVAYTIYGPGDADSPLNSNGAPDWTGDAVVVVDADSDGLTNAEGLYTYFFDLSNTHDSVWDVTSFVLGGGDLPILYVDIGYLGGSGDVSPDSIQYTTSASMRARFGSLEPGATSCTLFITSGALPGTVDALITNGFPAEGVLPAPVVAVAHTPEPSSMLLLGSFASGLLVARRVRTRKK